MNRATINNILKVVGGAISGVVAHHYGSQLLEKLDNKFIKFSVDDRQNTVVESDSIIQEETIEDCRHYFKNMMDIFSEFQSDINRFKEAKSSDVVSKAQGKVGELMDDSKSLLDIITSTADFGNKGPEIAKRMDSGLKELDAFLNEIKRNGSNFISDFDLNKIYSYLDTLSSYLDTLSLQQEGALFNIIVLLTMLLTIFSLLGVFFGNEIIKFFDLENKLPRLSIFFKIRTKLQRYYLMWNLFILFSLCIGGLCINILAFVVA